MNDLPNQIAERKILKVSQITYQVRQLLENNFSLVWVEGEISNLAQPSSGHIYFSLKDETTQIRCAMFKSKSTSLNFALENGKKVIALAQVSLYEPRGDFQLIIQALEPAGAGILHEKFLQLKNQLAAEGLFDAKYKKPLPTFANTIGIITSETGAAIRDILTILKRRFSPVPIIIYPTLVQGPGSVEQIVQAINTANTRNEVDVLILSRGGGSIEDLWSFNEEKVARAIFASRIPIISAVGHEIDFTIADFVADYRAPTPSAAAEIVVPEKTEITSNIHQLHKRLINLTLAKIRQTELLLLSIKNRLHHPLYYLQQQAQKIDDLEHRLRMATNKQLENWQQRIKSLNTSLAMINPYATLNRGYAIVLKNQKAIQSCANIKSGDNLEIKMSDGKIEVVAS